MRRTARGLKRSSLSILAAAVGLLPACFSPTEPRLGSELLLTGTWYTYDFGYAGNLDSLSTRADGGRVTGAWREYRSGALAITATVSGGYDTSGAFALRLAYSSGDIASYVGKVFGADHVAGTWTDSSKAIWGNLTFFRAPPPPCSNPLPVLGQYIPPLAPAYFIGFLGTVDAMTEAARLAGRYAFTVDQYSTTPPKGFTAQLTPAQLMVLQCEASVDSIAYTSGLLG